MSSEEEDDLLAACAVVVACSRVSVRRKPRVVWCDEYLLERESERRFPRNNVMKELRTSPNSWFKILRMNEESYLTLLKLISPFVEKKDTVMRPAIPANKRLTATLMYLTTGKSFEELKLHTRVSAQSLGNIVRETCTVLHEVLGRQYVKLPQTEEDWQAVADDFDSRCHFPHCLGAVGGKHVDISPPPCSGSFYLNHEGRNSVVLVAATNAKHEFMFCDAGTNGAFFDGRSIRKTEFYESLVNDSLNLPPEGKVGGSDHALPFVFAGHDAFPMLPTMLTSFESPESSGQTIFNRRLVRVRETLENVLGIMATRFGVLNTRINLKPERIKSVVCACCVLHNYMMRSSANYAPPECFDEESESGTVTEGLRADDSHMMDIKEGFLRNPDEVATSVRNDFADYFANEGRLSRQDIVS